MGQQNPTSPILDDRKLKPIQNMGCLEDMNWCRISQPSTVLVFFAVQCVSLPHSNVANMAETTVPTATFMLRVAHRLQLKRE